MVVVWWWAVMVKRSPISAAAELLSVVRLSALKQLMMLPGTAEIKYYLGPRLSTKNNTISKRDFITKMIFKDV